MPSRRAALVASALVSLWLSARPSTARATDYHLDSMAGDDAATGLSPTAAWRSAGPLGRITLRPGDRVLFRRGGDYDTSNARFGTDSWDPGLWIQADAAGTATNRIVFTAYGEGALPRLRNGRGTEGSSALTLRGAYVTVDGLGFRDTRDAAIIVEGTATHALITNCEFERVGAGLTVYGANALITRNHFHDGVMIHNTMGGDDDYGANGIVLSGPDAEISYNLAERLAAPSFDYGTDGGFVELYGALSNVSVHHNTVRDSNGFAEGGSNGGRAQSNLTFAYNLSVDNGSMSTLHNGGDGFAAVYSAVLFTHNTIVNTAPTSTIFWTSRDATAGSITVRNNIVVAGGARVYTRPGLLTHDHNLYTVIGSLGLTAGDGELVADPRFVDAAGGDFHLRADSPAIDVGAGTALFATDLDETPVPSGDGLDLGAFEFAVATVDAGTLDAGDPSLDAGGMEADAGDGDAGPGAVDGGASMADAGAGIDDGGGPVADGALGAEGGLPSGPSGTPGGCACATAGASRSPLRGVALVAWAMLVGVGRRLRRRARPS